SKKLAAPDFEIDVVEHRNIDLVAFVVLGYLNEVNQRLCHSPSPGINHKGTKPQSSLSLRDFVPLWLTPRFHFYARAVRQVLSSANDNCFAACESLFDFNSIAHFSTRRHCLQHNSPIFDYEHNAFTIALRNCGLRYGDSTCF